MRILIAPYEERDSWELNVMSLNGTLYFEEHLSEAKITEKNDIPPRHRIQMYYGYSFESYCSSSRPGRREEFNTPDRHVNGWGGDVNTNVQWCSVVKTKLGDTRLLIGGEVDCVRDKFSGKTDTFVELKTSLTIRSARDEARFEKKLLKFYFQSFLLGVPEIVVGFRTPQGQLSTIQSFKTIQIPRMVRDKENAWDPSICLGWGKRFIDFLKTNCASSDSGEDEKVWRVSFSPRVGVTLRRIEDEEVKEVVEGEDRIGFLPRWYYDDIHKTAHAADPADNPTPASHPTSANTAGWRI